MTEQRELTIPARSLSYCRILDLTRAVAGPYCSMILADLGADVIKVESKDGGDISRAWGPYAKDISVYFLSVNRNKRSIAIDLRTPAGLETVRKMAAQCDVLVENFRPHIAEQMGLGYETLSIDNPGLVYASISGFGRGGPCESWPGLDQIAQGVSGLMSVTGSASCGPFRTGIPIADLTAGMWAAIGVLSALLSRQSSGRGQRVDTSLLASLIGMLSIQGQRYLTLGEVATATGNEHPIIAPYGAFQTLDGALNIAVATDAMWRRFCHILNIDIAEHPDYYDNAARVANREKLKHLVETQLRTRAKDCWAALFIDAGIPAGPINRIDQALEDRHVLASGCVETVCHPILGIVRQLASPIRFGSFPDPSSRSAPPLLGQHTVEVLQDFHFDEAFISTLINSGIVADAKSSMGQQAMVGTRSGPPDQAFGSSA
jgi:crotonobetainyl-CoA:carnitine CoA-transferase CaiB-like acyl-CoA transferase